MSRGGADQLASTPGPRLPTTTTTISAFVRPLRKARAVARAVISTTPSPHHPTVPHCRSTLVVMAAQVESFATPDGDQHTNMDPNPNPDTNPSRTLTNVTLTNVTATLALGGVVRNP